jgi:bifunctional DNA-binding transcriptional regulator/antitoxin component of YhaV-PrlF toxin-antitoxin module
MAAITIRQRNQITLPPEAVAALGLRVGDTGEATVQGNAVIIRFRSREAARSGLERAYGALTGVWGSTHEEIQATIDRDRDSWEREGI